MVGFAEGASDGSNEGASVGGSDGAVPIDRICVGFAWSLVMAAEKSTEAVVL